MAWLGSGSEMRDRAERIEHYRSKAEEARIVAESLRNAEAKEFMIGVAADYMMLARLLKHMDDPIPASE